jgi:hypothetical protein
MGYRHPEQQTGGGGSSKRRVGAPKGRVPERPAVTRFFRRTNVFPGEQRIAAIEISGNSKRLAQVKQFHEFSDFFRQELPQV